jgi:uncharacterized HAD superfamily protein
MFKIVFVSLLFLSAAAYTQVKVEPTNQFIIEGNIDKAVTVSVHTVDILKAKSLGDVTTLHYGLSISVSLLDAIQTTYT